MRSADPAQAKAKSPGACLPFQCSLHGRSAQLHVLADGFDQCVRQNVGDPDQACAVLAIGKDLKGRVVMHCSPTDRCINEPADIVIESDDPLARHHAMGERDDPGVAIQPCIHQHARYQAYVGRTDVADGRPYVRGSASRKISL